MQKFLARIILLGILICALIGVGWGCGGGGGSSTATKETGTRITEPKELIEATDQIEEAFTRGDPEQLETYIHPDTLELYKTVIEENAEKLAGFAEIFKTRKLLWTDGLQAVYEVTYEGQKFEITMVLDTDGNWKLADF